MVTHHELPAMMLSCTWTNANVSQFHIITVIRTYFNLAGYIYYAESTIYSTTVDNWMS